MFGVEAVEPWIGPSYGQTEPKIMVVGDTRYSKTYRDRRIVQDQVEGRRDPVFTKFTQAVIGKPTSAPGYDADARAFWRGVLFYNYNTIFFPEKAGTRLDWAAANRPTECQGLAGDGPGVQADARHCLGFRQLGQHRARRKLGEVWHHSRAGDAGPVWCDVRGRAHDPIRRRAAPVLSGVSFRTLGTRALCLSFSAAIVGHRRRTLTTEHGR